MYGELEFDSDGAHEVISCRRNKTAYFCDCIHVYNICNKTTAILRSVQSPTICNKYTSLSLTHCLCVLDVNIVDGFDVHCRCRRTK